MYFKEDDECSEFPKDLRMRLELEQSEANQESESQMEQNGDLEQGGHENSIENPEIGKDNYLSAMTKKGVH